MSTDPRMVQIEWTAAALSDVREVHDHIARDSPRYAEITVQRIQDAVGRLALFPKLGHVLQEYVRSPYRQILVGKYRILYRYQPRKNIIYVVAIIHGSRDLRAALRRRRRKGR